MLCHNARVTNDLQSIEMEISASWVKVVQTGLPYSNEKAIWSVPSKISRQSIAEQVDALGILKSTFEDYGYGKSV